MHFRFVLTICLLCCIATFLHAQERYVTFSGRVQEAGSHDVIPGATLQLKNAGVGTACNAAGEFVFKAPGHLLPDSLLVSSMGYQPLTVALPESGVALTLQLEKAIVTLPGVTVTAVDGLALVKEAIARIPENYDTGGVRLNAFYREYIRLREDTLNYNESVLDIFKTYNTTKTYKDQVRIVKGRKINTDDHGDPRFHSFISNITNTAYSSLSEDVQKIVHNEHSFLDADNFPYYNYTYLETLHQGDSRLLVIQIKPKKPNKHALLSGTLYLDETSKAIAGCDWAITPEGLDYVNKHGKGGVGYTIMTMVLHATLDFKDARNSMTYKPYKGKWYLSSMHRHWNMDVNSDRRNLHKVPWTGDFTLQVTGVNKDSTGPFTGNVADRVNSVNNQISMQTDTAFWEHYNFVLPELPDSLRKTKDTLVARVSADSIHLSNRQNGFTRADTLRGMLTPLRTCYDVTYYDLDADIDLDHHYLHGSNRIRFKVMMPFNRMQVDLYANMKINEILYHGQPVAYTREYDAVFLQLPATLQSGEDEVFIRYEGTPQTGDFSKPMWGGVLWDHDEQGNPWVQMVCQGSGASLWWPSKDHQSDEPDSMRIRITIPIGFTEISNGRLLSKTSVGADKTRFEWNVTYPINNYNVTFCLGKYTHWRDYLVRNDHDTLTLDYYVLPDHLQRGKEMFAQVPHLLRTYERDFGPYPFPRDGFTLLESPYPMEHQSSVCIGKALSDSNAILSPTMLWHEVAHEWWGNAITVKDIADMWVHEGFATYAESLFVEDSMGNEVALQYRNREKDAVKGQEPVIGVYNVNHIHYDIGDMYSKGSLLLHTFRNVLDDDKQWFQLLRDIQSHFRYQTLSSEELVAYVCQQTGKDYRPLFDQYLKHTNIPTFEYTLHQQGASLQLRYRWQADEPTFNMPLKVTQAAGKMTFIYPTTTWKTITIPHLHADDFATDEDHFYINTKQLK